MKNLFRFSFITFLVVGLFACNNAPAGEQATVGEAEAAANASAKAVSYKVDTGASLVNWVGSKPGGQHMGTIKLVGGKFAVANGTIESGKFRLDMNSIECTDLEGDSKAGLEGHLKGSSEDGADDFFNVTKYPTADFVITNVATLAGDSLMTHSVKGNLTMKDSTFNVEFKANIEISENGVTAESNDFTIDRTKWGIKFMSPTALNLKDKFINDEIGLKIQLVATKPAE